MAYLVIKTQCAETELVQEYLRNRCRAGAQTRMVGNRMVAVPTSAAASIKCVADERQAVDNLGICLQRSLRAEDVANGRDQEVAVQLVENNTQAGHDGG